MEMMKSGDERKKPAMVCLVNHILRPETFGQE